MKSILLSRFGGLNCKVRILGIFFLLISSAGMSYGQDALYVNLTGPSNADPGDTLTYIVTFANNGTGQAQNVVITHTLPDPSYYTFVSAESVGGSYLAVPAGNVIVFYPSLVQNTTMH